MITQEAFDDLKAQVVAIAEDRDQLKRELGLTLDRAQISRVADKFRLTPNQAAVVMALYAASGRFVTRDHLMEALYCDRAEQPYDAIIAVLLSQIRKKIGQGAIENKPRLGWKLSAAGVERVKKAVTVVQ